MFMAAERFVCPDGVEYPICECLVECRMKERCMFLPTLQSIARSQERGLSGFSVTELIGGTREAYLKRTRKYSIDPQKQMFALQGNAVHHWLQQFQSSKVLQEVRLHGDHYSGQFDVYGAILDLERDTLGDIKVTSSYKIMKALGYYQEALETTAVYKSGPRKGQPRKLKIWREDGVRGVLEWAIQLNAYRMLLAEHGLPVKKMVIQAICRDSSLRVAQERNLERSVYLIPIRRISDHWVKGYLEKKADLLKSALEQESIPCICSERERWKDRKCLGFCEVAPYCDHAQVLREKATSQWRKEKAA